VTLETTPFEGYGCVRLEGERSTLFVTVSVGPRIIGLVGAGPNVMAVLPHASLERLGGSPFRLLGGHRLWAAPEMPEITYELDERPCEVTSIEGGARVQAPPDGAGFVKALEVRPSGDRWVVDHELRNAAEEPITVAAWAITQLRPGGTASLPLGERGSGRVADRALVLWPYTDLDDPRLRFGRDAVDIEAVAGTGPVKVGAAPGQGRASYRLGTEVFEKTVDVDPDLPRADLGAAVQVYVGQGFCELETLGPLVALEPGESTRHRETWELREEGP
jgi:hypothetical protein